MTPVRIAPRTGNARLHDLLMIALCTVLCGGQRATDMAEFARAKEIYVRDFLKLSAGLPSHDTFSRLFRLLDCSDSVARAQVLIPPQVQSTHAGRGVTYPYPQAKISSVLNNGDSNS
ncbi:MAG: transposase family protein [Proteobacteria bacterium]|nr:transposase family protein [Pseudomonadota bacterium]